jgi:hypothetical protein
LSYEKLVKLYLARIAAYDKQGPKLNSVITLNPKALDTEFKKSGRRSPQHGIPLLVLAYAYAYEQATKYRVSPATTPKLVGEVFEY